jgi:hypothetical protein
LREEKESEEDFPAGGSAETGPVDFYLVFKNPGILHDFELIIQN